MYLHSYKDFVRYLCNRQKKTDRKNLVYAGLQHDGGCPVGPYILIAIYFSIFAGFKVPNDSDMSAIYAYSAAKILQYSDSVLALMLLRTISAKSARGL